MDPIKSKCVVCNAEPDQACLNEDGTPGSLGAFHVGRLTNGQPLRVVHTGQYNADGGAILEAATAKGGLTLEATTGELPPIEATTGDFPTPSPTSPVWRTFNHEMELELPTSLVPPEPYEA